MEGRSIAIDSKGDLYICGDYDGLVDFDPGDGVATLEGFINSFVLKLSSDGEFQWVADNDGVLGRKVILNNGDQPFALFEDSGPNSEGFLEITKLSERGDSLWTNSVEAMSTFSVSPRGIEFNNEESIFLTANFSEEFKYDPNSEVSIMSVDDDADFIYLKLEQDAVLPARELLIHGPANIFPNPVSEIIHLEFDRMHQQIEVQIFDLLGKSILRRKFANASRVKIPFHFQSGPYYLKYSVPGKEVIQKIQKI